ncbi:hypothetical protein, partial [Mannheimia haemolytica]|uniref:hypothetical protein n=1 Tax=Mannheimia haemolytica TaxID=75985 RepID=UPI00192DF204
PYFDGAASILIGLILIAISALLAKESRSLLLGESADPEELQAIQNMLEAEPTIEKVLQPLSIYLGPEEVVLLLKVLFKPELTSAAVAASIR